MLLMEALRAKGVLATKPMSQQAVSDGKNG